ncbi:MAG TPA: ubiquitin-like protein Pup [Actinomycetota bacterium]|nr:ubiquitin-like protein Pup [Actinomycetota bacterium]
MSPSGEQSKKPKPKKDEEQAKAEETTKAESRTEDVDELLDEIDSVLEANAEEFVRSYIQKGGQ